MDKRILRQIARRYAKSILVNLDGLPFLDGDLLDEDEVEFILNTVKDIGEKITKDDPVSDVKELIGQYYISS